MPDLAVDGADMCETFGVRPEPWTLSDPLVFNDGRRVERPLEALVADGDTCVVFIAGTAETEVGKYCVPIVLGPSTETPVLIDDAAE